MNAPPPTRKELFDKAVDLIRIVDTRGKEINREWGFNRLPYIVPIEWMQKFQRQKKSWQQVCYDCVGSILQEDLDRMQVQADAMLRAYDKLVELAIASGRSPARPEQWQFELKNGVPIILVRERYEMSQITQTKPLSQVWCLEEIAGLIEKFPSLFDGKDMFPQAEIVKITTDTYIHDKLNDELNDIPW